MAVAFTIQGFIDVIAQTLCGGSVAVAGLLVMVGAVMMSAVVFGALKAPVHYALVPMILLDIVFTAMGIINTTLSFIIIIVCAVMMARQVRDIVGGSRWGSCLRGEGTTGCRSSSPSSGSSSASW